MIRRSTIALSLLLFAGMAQADEEEAQIVTTCHYGNAEWGNDMIQRCIDENRALRAEVLRMPAEYADALLRCRQSAELGWTWVKTCVLKDAAARDALEAYPREAVMLIEACKREFGGQGFVAVRDCADRMLNSTRGR